MNAASLVNFGASEYLITLILPVAAIEGVSFHFAQTEHEFGPSKKRFFTRIWYLSILLISAFTIFKIDPQVESTLLLWNLVLIIPFLGIASYMGFFSLVLLFEKKEK